MEIGEISKILLSKGWGVTMKGLGQIIIRYTANNTALDRANIFA